MQDDSIQTTSRSHSCRKSEDLVGAITPHVIIQTAMAHLLPSITGKDTSDTHNAETGHIQEWTSKKISQGDKEAAYHTEEQKDEDKRANTSVQTRNNPGTVKDASPRSEKQSSYMLA